MDFDPLSLFTPATQKEVHDNEDVSISTFEEKSLNLDSETHPDVPLHIYDLPLLQLKPPAEVLLVFLKLLSPDEVYNFAPVEQNDDSEVISSKVFEEKNIALSEIAPSIEWLSKFSTRFHNELALAYVPSLCIPLRKNPEYNSWLTKLISSKLDWVSPAERAQIVKETSLRISENCGRTAQPEIIRKIQIPSLSRYLKEGNEFVRLKEPSLTSDNLGLKTWGSALILSNRLVRSPEYLKAPVLELGSGTGLVGMVCAIMGFETLLTDLKEILPNLKDNVELNGISDLCSVDELDWSDPESFIKTHGSIKFKTIILSDPIYSSKHPQWVINMVNCFLDQDKQSRVLLQIPVRKNFEKERETLWSIIENNGYKITDSDTETGYDDFGENHFYFKRLERK